MITLVDHIDSNIATNPPSHSSKQVHWEDTHQPSLTPVPADTHNLVDKPTIAHETRCRNPKLKVTPTCSHVDLNQAGTFCSLLISAFYQKKKNINAATNHI